MNLGQAVAVCLYELARGKESPRREQSQLASAGDAERITGTLLDALSLADTSKSAAHPTPRKKSAV